MKTDQLATLTSLLSPYVELGNHRLQTLCLLITAMVSARTVNLSHLAAERASEVLVASTYRRLQRFFQYVRPPEDWAAQLIVALSGAKPPWLLCLDRTNRKIGKKEANILMLAIVTLMLPRFRGHPTSCGGGRHDAEDKTTLSPRVPPADGRTRTFWPEH